MLYNITNGCETELNSIIIIEDFDKVRIAGLENIENLFILCMNVHLNLSQNLSFLIYYVVHIQFKKINLFDASNFSRISIIIDKILTVVFIRFIMCI